jgi:hypothetical protein
MFDLAQIRKRTELEQVQDTGALPNASDDDDESDLSGSDDDSNSDSDADSDLEYSRAMDKYLDRQYEEYIAMSRSRTKRIRKGKKQKTAEPDLNELYDGIADEVTHERQKSRFDSSSDEDSDDEHEVDADNNPLLVKAPLEKQNASVRSAMWFSQDMFGDVDEFDGITDGNFANPAKGKNKATAAAAVQDDDDDEEEQYYDVEDDDEQEGQTNNKAAKSTTSTTEQKLSRTTGKSSRAVMQSNEADDNDDEDGDDDSDGSKRRKLAADNTFEVVPVPAPAEDDESDIDDDERAEILALVCEKAVAVVLDATVIDALPQCCNRQGSLVATGNKKWSQLLDDGYNRYAHNDTYVLLLLVLMAIGCWLLAVGCWLLAVGCWLLAVG